jgi:hypothetical protein
MTDQTSTVQVSTVPSQTGPAAVYQALKARLKARAYANLDNVNEVCAQIHEARGSAEKKDYSIATVARKLKASGKGPSYNTLNAPGGAHFKQLILAWAQSDGATMARPLVEPAPGSEDELLNKIDNEAVRNEVKILLVQARSILFKYNLLKSKANITVDMRVKDGTALAQGKGAAPQVLAPQPVLAPVEVAALKNALNPERLKSFGITIGEGGELLHRGRSIMETGFASGYKTVLKFAHTLLEHP